MEVNTEVRNSLPPLPAQNMQTADISLDVSTYLFNDCSISFKISGFVGWLYGYFTNGAASYDTL
jgi:hypothetical protein